MTRVKTNRDNLLSGNASVSETKHSDTGEHLLFLLLLFSLLLAACLLLLFILRFASLQRLGNQFQQLFILKFLLALDFTRIQCGRTR